MDYSNSFIPRLPSRYTLDKATMTESLIELQPGGSVSIKLTAEDIQTAPENMRLTIMADKYTDAYAPDAFVDIQITNPDVSYRFLNPIVDTNNGFCITELTLDSKEDYTDFVFTIRSAQAMKILSWELAGPASTSEEYIEEMRKELPRLLKDYNEMPYLVGQEETTICLISAFLVKNTDLNGHLQVSYRSTEDCQVIMRAKDNDITELFSPVIIDIKAGRGSIDIPHAYVEKFIGYHNFACTLQVTNGMLKIPTRAVLYTVDGGHLAERVMDVGMDVRDIVIRRIVTDNDPSYIYAIGVDDGLITVKARAYNEVANTAWEPRMLVGEGKEAAITFNGDWAQDKNGWRLNTDSDPWIFWVDTENNLWTQYFDDGTTKSQLATDVVDVSVVMGWRNPVFIYQDQGVIALYSKTDGTVFYRNYCTQIGGVKTWDNERQITQFDGLAENVFVFRTNDYRVGIRIKNNAGVSTVLLTTRNWAGMAVQPHTITAAAGGIKVDFIAIEYIKGFATEETITGAPAEMLLDLRYAQTDNRFIDIYNQAVLIGEVEDWGKELIFRTQNKLYNISRGDFEIIDSFNRAYYPNTAEEINDRVYKLSFTEFNNFNNVDDIGTLKFRGLVTTNGVNVVYLPFEKVFYPINLIPTSIPLPEVKEVWNE